MALIDAMIPRLTAVGPRAMRTRGQPNRASSASPRRGCGHRRRPRSSPGHISAMLWNGVIRMPRLRAWRCRKRSSSRSWPRPPPRDPLRGGSARNAYSTRQPSRVTCQGSAVGGDHLVDAGLEALAERDHPLEGLLGEHVLERRPRRRQRERVARQRAADPADVGDLERVDVRGDPVGDLLAHPVGGGRARRRRSACRS